MDFAAWMHVDNVLRPCCYFSSLLLSHCRDDSDDSHILDGFLVVSHSELSLPSLHAPAAALWSLSAFENLLRRLPPHNKTVICLFECAGRLRFLLLYVKALNQAGLLLVETYPVSESAERFFLFPRADVWCCPCCAAGDIAKAAGRD